jgi:hypothetical protein
MFYILSFVHSALKTKPMKSDVLNEIKEKKLKVILISSEYLCYLKWKTTAKSVIYA